MPSNFSYLDTNFPTFTAGQDTETKITKVQNYLYMLLEQLRYTLNNLDERNFNEAGLQNITEPIYARIEDDEGYISQLQLDAKSLRAELYDSNTGDITQLQATAGSLISQVSSLDGSVSTLGQTVNGMYLSVSNGTDRSTISLVRNGVSVSSQTIRFTGGVVFESDLEDGNTVIDGSCIRTGYISSEYIEITGAVATYAGEDGDLTGYLGYVEGMNGDGDTTYGIGITAVNSRGAVRGQCYVTDSGARLAYRNYTSVTCTSGKVSITGNSSVEIYPEGSGDCWVFHDGEIYWSGTGEYRGSQGRAGNCGADTRGCGRFDDTKHAGSSGQRPDRAACKQAGIRIPLVRRRGAAGTAGGRGHQGADSVRRSIRREGSFHGNDVQHRNATDESLWRRRIGRCCGTRHPLGGG